MLARTTMNPYEDDEYLREQTRQQIIKQLGAASTPAAPETPPVKTAAGAAPMPTAPITGPSTPSPEVANTREPAPTAPVDVGPSTTTAGTSSRGWGLSPQGQRVEFDYQADDAPYSAGAFRGSMEGFNADKFDPAHPEASSLKMVAAREMEKIDPYDPQAVAKLASSLNGRGIRVEVVGSYGDKLHFLDTGEIVDVLRNADFVGGDPNATVAWAWMPDWAQGGATPSAAGPTAAGLVGGAPGSAGPALDPLLTGGDVQADIQAAIEELIRGGNGTFTRQALLEQMGR